MPVGPIYMGTRAFPIEVKQVKDESSQSFSSGAKI